MRMRQPLDLPNWEDHAGEEREGLFRGSDRNYGRKDMSARAKFLGRAPYAPEGSPWKHYAIVSEGGMYYAHSIARSKREALALFHA